MAVVVKTVLGSHFVGEFTTHFGTIWILTHGSMCRKSGSGSFHSVKMMFLSLLV